MGCVSSKSATARSVPTSREARPDTTKSAPLPTSAPPPRLTSRRDTLGFQGTTIPIARPNLPKQVAPSCPHTPPLARTAAEAANALQPPRPSAVHANVTKFERLNVQARCAPALRSIAVADVARSGKTSSSVTFFEQIEATARRAPDPTATSCNVPRGANILARVKSFEGLERQRRDELALASLRMRNDCVWETNKSVSM